MSKDDNLEWMKTYDYNSEPPEPPNFEDYGSQPQDNSPETLSNLEDMGKFVRNAYRFGDKHIAHIMITSLVYSMHNRGGFTYNQIANVLTRVLIDGGGFHRSHNCFGELEPAPKDKEDDAG
jgi:hypothetical protein